MQRESYTKLNLSQAYQELLVDKESRKFTTINTHKIIIFML